MTEPMDTLLAVASLLAYGLMLAGVLCIMLPGSVVRTLSRSRDEVSVSIRLLASGLVLVGLCLLMRYGRELWMANEVDDWIPVTAIITHSQIHEVMQPRSTTPGWRPHVDYRYMHHGREYTGNRVGLGIQLSSDRNGSQSWLEQTYPPQARVRAWIDPDAPHSSTLDRAISPWNWALLLAGVLLAGVGVHLLRLSRIDSAVTARHNRRKKRRRKGVRAPVAHKPRE